MSTLVRLQALAKYMEKEERALLERFIVSNDVDALVELVIKLVESRVNSWRW